MKTEWEKCMNGEWYDCHAQLFMALKIKTRELLLQYNTLPYDDKTARYSLLKEMFGSVGANVSVGNPFICDYGQNIHIGDNVSVNMNCTFVDCNKITVGNRVLIASNVQIYTAAHPVELNERLTPGWTADSGEYFWRTFALPVTIGDDCWIGGGAIIVPGVTIGRGSVIGAGSVVTKDIPENSLAVGNPCRVIRKLNGHDSDTL
ncbi:MAG: sugar O-acetyltransferase [Mediterranea sp.]|jgi:acetyltransferase-like isoleucine patch superfamily enzyme|nr:sugar O-acetyltransferase [Mediterranea sp.]